MQTAEERRWELIKRYLLSDAAGEQPSCVRSQRTLFGIKSSVEELIDRTVAEDEASWKAKSSAHPHSSK